MNRRVRVIVIVLISMLGAAEGPTLAQRPAISLAEALERARRANPGLEAARQATGEARGQLTSAQLPVQDNVEVEAKTGSRRSTAVEPSSSEMEVELEQRLEVGGQRRHRIEEATAWIGAAEAAAADAARQLDMSVAEVFYETLAAVEAVQLLEQNGQLATDLAELARRRLELGEGTQLELNTSRIRGAEASRRLAVGRASLGSALVTLAELLAVPHSEAPEPEGVLPTSAPVPGETELLAQAAGSRPDLLSQQREVDRARAAVALADAERVPDVAVGVSYGREEGRDVALAGVRVPLPIIQRNQGERETARAALRRQEAQLEQLRLAVEAELRRAWRDYETALAASRLYDAEVLSAQRESSQLLEQAYAAGEVDYTELVVIQRELLDGRLGAVEARLDLARAIARLLAAVHLPQTQARNGGAP